MGEVMKAFIDEVMSLQPLWQSSKTPDMERRGQIIRHEMRSELEAWLQSSLVPGARDLAVLGKDHTGRRAEIPWVRVYSPALSPAPTQGWYLVYLFSAEGSDCYLSLIRGSTQWTGSEFKPRPIEELQALSDWARAVGADLLTKRNDLVQKIHMEARKTDLGPTYEAGSAVAIRYRLGEVPSDETLKADLDYMTEVLLRIYALQPSVEGNLLTESPEVMGLSSRMNRRMCDDPLADQGLTPDEQDALDQHGLDLALAHYQSEGWQVSVSDAVNWALIVTKGATRRHVQTKASTSLGDTVLLSAEEVHFHRDQFPENSLFVVRGVRLESDGLSATALGGEVTIWEPWAIDPAALRPLAYRYVLPKR